MNKQEAKSFVEQLAKHGSQRAAAAAMGIAQSNVSGKFNKARAILGEEQVAKILGTSKMTASDSRKAVADKPAAPGTPAVSTSETRAADLVEGDPEKIAALALEEENRRLRAQNKALADSALTDAVVRQHIFEIAHSKPAIPEWLSMPGAAGKANALPGVPILLGSDWHWGEVVKPAEIGGVNEYNLDIARSRLNRLIETTIDLLTNHMVNPQYPGIVFALAGDMVSGDIHEELSVTNDMPIMPVVLDLVDNLYPAIKRLKEVFGRVFLPCVAGNHGRNTKKVQSKEFNFRSFDWLIYQQLDRLFADDPDVTFFIPEGTDAHVTIAGHRYCFTHGNQYRGGDGMIGPLGPITRGDHKKRSRDAQVGLEYDTQVIGHFHQLIQMKRIIVNGSLIGYNEYASSNNFGYEPPQQALWVTHPEHGITFSMPVKVGDDVGRTRKGEKDTGWVSWHVPPKKAA